jgi:hypothetical protein
VPPTEVDSTGGQGNSSNACSQLQEPADGGTLNKAGQVKFAWSEQPDAQTYIITFVKEDGSTARIETSSNSAEFYIEVLPAGGNYQWFVTAYGADGNAICTSATNQFNKPKADPTEKTKIKSEETKEPIACDPCDMSGSCYDYYTCSWGE